MPNLDIQHPACKENALVLARVSQLAYSPSDVVQASIRAEFGWDAELIEVENVQAVVAYCREQTVVAFRGSEIPLTSDGLHDWLDVLNIELTCPDRGVMDLGTDIPVFHSGFAGEASKIWPKLSARLAELKRQYPVGTVWFTGHSLGGALAILAGAAVGSPATVVTFGSPRVATGFGCAVLADRLAGQIYRFVHDRDPVPHLPQISLRGVIIPQLGQCVKLQEKHFWECRVVQLIFRWLTLGMAGVFWDILRSRIDYHLIQNYITALRKM